MTKIQDIMDYKKLNELIKDGYISKNDHPSFPLSILNYTPTAQYDPKLEWGKELNFSRGLIYNNITNEVISLPYAKFWNIDTEAHPETLQKNLPTDTPLILDKADGSLAIFYEWDGSIYIATRGSFVSDQANWANNWIKKNHTNLIIPSGYTLLGEIIYKENKIVVDYPWEGVIIHGMMNNETSKEIFRIDLEKFCAEQNLSIVDKFTDKNLATCLAEDIKNREGYVLTYANGLKIKAKFATYFKLHKLLTNLNENDIIDLMQVGNFKQLLEWQSDHTLPESFRTMLKSKLDEYNQKYEDCFQTVSEIYYNRPTTLDRKEIAEYFSQFPDYKSILFSMYDQNNRVWAKIRS
jgi:RNA ligase